MTRAATRWPPSAGGCRIWPWRRIMRFIGPEGKMSLLDLFDGRRQLLVTPSLAIKAAMHSYSTRTTQRGQATTSASLRSVNRTLNP